jgi:hypothetical protein
MCGTHVDYIWVVTEICPFWLNDAFEILRVPGEDILVDLEDDVVVALACFYFEEFAAETGDERLAWCEHTMMLSH